MAIKRHEVTARRIFQGDIFKADVDATDQCEQRGAAAGFGQAGFFGFVHSGPPDGSGAVDDAPTLDGQIVEAVGFDEGQGHRRMSGIAKIQEGR